MLSIIKLAESTRPEIDEHTSKLLVGVIAISLPFLTSYFSAQPLDSISASYHEIGWSRDIFVGFLFAIFAFLLSYNGKEPCKSIQMIMSRAGAFSALLVALFPCKCIDHKEIIPYVHGIASGVMFLILAAFCVFFILRARGKTGKHAQYRVWIYVLCAFVILAAISTVGIDLVLKGAISSSVDRFMYKAEFAGLFVFGLAWLTASQLLPILASGNKWFQNPATDDEESVQECRFN